ncbi:MAG: plasmid pRiA4b ORF-3 family protein [Spirochaetaceae bacterium]|jgi:hypothetical protein|nr:plasmid pRiA4b ORF-3 family protein [Spirochaetaceae bacterium]
MNRKTPSEHPRRTGSVGDEIGFISRTGSAEGRTLVLRVKIADIDPPIWRELSVPGEYTLGHLHVILQIAFGWENDHMHSFTIKSTQYGMTGMDFGFDDEEDIVDEDTVCLDDLGLRTHQKFRYLYDFGDSWEHEIAVSKIISTGDEEGEPALPLCLGGERAGPLEDSGGSWEYENTLQILKDPNHAKYEETREWTGDFDPENFDLEEINSRLKHVFKPRPTRAKKAKASGGKEEQKPK